MKMVKRFSAMLLTAAMVLSLAACGGAGAPSSASAPAAPSESASAASSAPEPVTLRLSWWGGESRHNATQAAVDAFMKKYPHITVKSEFGAWTGWEENVSTQLMSNTAPDVMQINWNWITAYSGDGSRFLNLNGVSDILDLTQWNKDALAQCTIGGNNLQAIPVAVTGRVLYWNATTFEKAGVPVPTTIKHLKAAGEAFKTKLGDAYYPLALNEYDRMIFMVYYLESKYGKDWVTDDKLNYTEAEIKDGLDFLLDLEASHVIPTQKKLDGDGADSLDKNQSWIDGHYAGIFEWDSSASKFIKAAEGSKIIVGEYFTDIGQYQGGFTKISMGFAVAKSSQHPKEAALLIQYLLNEEEGVAIMASERGIPASAAAFKLCKEKNLIDPVVSEANTKVSNYAKFSLDPMFESNTFKSDPDGLYFQVMAKVSYGQIDTAAGAAEFFKGITEAMAA